MAPRSKNQKHAPEDKWANANALWGFPKKLRLRLPTEIRSDRNSLSA